MKTMEPKLEEAKKKKVAFGAAGLSLFIHGALLVLIGGVVVVEYAVPRSPIIGELSPVVSEEAASPEEAPEPAGEPDSSEALPETSTSAPPLSALEMNTASVEVITVNSPVPSFQVPVMSGGGGTGSGSATGTASSGNGGKSGAGKISNPFGGVEKLNDSSWEGVLYDLKQTKDAKPSGMNSAKYGDILRDFFAKNWNRRVLGDYYQVKKPLYTSQIYMPVMSAGIAPKAFNVENEVQPAQWVIIYTGTFQSPKTGQFRLVGYADDVMGVRLDGKSVLDGSRGSMGTPKGGTTGMLKLTNQEFIPGHKIGNGNLAYSDWFRFTEGDTHKIEILLGEQPGGQFCAYLFVEEKNKEYQKETSGRPILPIFRTADVETPQSSDGAFDPNAPVFGVK